MDHNHLTKEHKWKLLGGAALIVAGLGLYLVNSRPKNTNREVKPEAVTGRVKEKAPELKQIRRVAPKTTHRTKNTKKSVDAAPETKAVESIARSRQHAKGNKELHRMRYRQEIVNPETKREEFKQLYATKDWKSSHLHLIDDMSVSKFIIHPGNQP